MIVCDNPNVACLCYQNGRAVCQAGCSLEGLHDLGINSFNDRGWCHVYDAVSSTYGLQCNIIRPINGTYELYIQNQHTSPIVLTCLYTKWYQWYEEDKSVVPI